MKTLFTAKVAETHTCCTPGSRVVFVAISYVQCHPSFLSSIGVYFKENLGCQAEIFIHFSAEPYKDQYLPPSKCELENLIFAYYYEVNPFPSHCEIF